MRNLEKLNEDQLRITKSLVLGEVFTVTLQISTLCCGLCDAKLTGSNF